MLVSGMRPAKTEVTTAVKTVMRTGVPRRDGNYKFFNRGHRLSGLGPETLGIDRINTAGGRA